MRVLDDAVLAHRGALGAVRAEVERRLEHRLLPRPHAVLDDGVDRAADRAVRAHRALLLDLGARLLLRLRAVPITPYGSWLANAPAPAARPERLRNVRRSIVDRRAPASLFEARARSAARYRICGSAAWRPPYRRASTRSSRARARFRDSPVDSSAAAFRGSSTAVATVRRGGRGARAPRAEREQEAAAFDVGGRLRRTDACALRGDDVLMRTSKERGRDVMFAAFSIDGERVTFDRHEQTSEFCYSTVVVGNGTCVIASQQSIDPRAQEPSSKNSLLTRDRRRRRARRRRRSAMRIVSQQRAEVVFVDAPTRWRARPSAASSARTATSGRRAASRHPVRRVQVALRLAHADEEVGVLLLRRLGVHGAAGEHEAVPGAGERIVAVVGPELGRAERGQERRVRAARRTAARAARRTRRARGPPPDERRGCAQRDAGRFASQASRDVRRCSRS